VAASQAAAIQAEVGLARAWWAARMVVAVEGAEGLRADGTEASMEGQVEDVETVMVAQVVAQVVERRGAAPRVVATLAAHAAAWTVVEEETWQAVEMSEAQQGATPVAAKVAAVAATRVAMREEEARAGLVAR